MEILTDRFVQVANDIDHRLRKTRFTWKLERIGSSFSVSIVRDDGDENFTFSAMHRHAEYAMLNAYALWVQANYGKKKRELASATR